MGQELEAQITAKSEEISILQTQVDVLQHDRDVLQPVNQYIIKTQLEHSQINFLEAKLMRVEFLEGVSSHEVDRLREGLMDKIAEIHHASQNGAQRYITNRHSATYFFSWLADLYIAVDIKG